MEITKHKPKRNVGKYCPDLNLRDEVTPFVKVVSIIEKKDELTGEEWAITYGVTRKGYYFGWYNGTVPYTRDVEQYGCSKEIISYEEDDCLRIKGFVKWKGTNKFFLNEDGDKPRWIRLAKCRVIENKGKI